MALVDGIVTQGFQVASGQSKKDRRFPLGTIRMQAPFFAKGGLDFDSYFGGPWVGGTLNISIAPYTYEIVKPDHYFPAVKWTDIFPPENFFLIASEMVFRGKSFKALIYQADPKTKPDHFLQPGEIVEIIAPQVPGIAYGDPVRVDIDPRKIELVPNHG